MNAFTPFHGQHCETTATGTLLNHLGIELSEPMLFGLGEGLSFLFWNMKTLDFPFIGGRVKPDILTQNIAKNLGLALDAKETSSARKAWTNVAEKIDAGIPVGLKLDCFHLEYFSQPFHFAGHYVAMTDYDEKFAYLVDTAQQGSEVRTSLESLAKARAEKGPMSSRNRSYTISYAKHEVNLADAVTIAARTNAIEYLNPPIRNLSFKGIEKTSKEVLNWFDRSENVAEEFRTSAMLMERAGTGGSLFRNLFRDFLDEAATLTGNPILNAAHEDFVQIAADWSRVIGLFEEIAQTEDRSVAEEASRMFVALADSEFQAMSKLAKI